MKVDYHNPYPERQLPRWMIDREARVRRQKLLAALIGLGWLVLLLSFIYVMHECFWEFHAWLKS